MERELLDREHVELMTMRTSLPKRAIALIAAVTAAGAVAIAIRLADLVRWTVPDLGAAVALALVTVAGERFSMRFRFGDQTKHVTMTEAGYAAALILGVRPSALILGAALGVVVTNVLRGTALHKAAFNVGSFALALTAAAAVYRAALPAGAILATAPAMAAFFVVNAGTVVGVIAAVERRSFLSVFRPIARVEFLAAGGNAAAGIMVASVWWTPVAVAVVAVVLLVAAKPRTARRIKAPAPAVAG